ncbi:AMP-binding protein [Micromonospora sp. NPDC049301]|uniref:AMP-binding protein n=1 Tax=Micromonospora sp. NPDC049301 TaxID=3155723 RepID=UPI0034251546
MTSQTLYARFAASVSRWPEEVALKVGGACLTYRDLYRAAEALAARLVELHGGHPAAIGLLASRSPAAYIGYLAALRLGTPVVPLNPAFPPARNVSICALAGVDAVVVDDAGRQQVRPAAGTKTLVDLSGETWHGLLRSGVKSQASYPGEAGRIAYILFTSGSTGVPKGVPIEHRNVLPYIDFCIDRYDVGPGSRLSQTFDLTFDPSVFDLFVAWGGGATLVVPQKTELLAPVEYVQREGITHWYSVPSVVSFARRLGHLSPESMPTLRCSLFAGEQLTVAQAEAWRRAAPKSFIENIYGPTELSINCTAYRLPANPIEWPATSNATVPIGRVYPHLEGIILDEAGRPSQSGELIVRGPQRFAGYLEPRDNIGRFMTFDGHVGLPYDGTEPLTLAHWYRTGDRVCVHDGELVHLGRLDHQVKVRGHRVELGEIEAVMREHPRVEDAVVLALPAADQELELMAVYTGAPVPGPELRAVVRERLPLYMQPSKFFHIARLPLNQNGKTDRARLVLDLTAPRPEVAR